MRRRNDLAVVASVFVISAIQLRGQTTQSLQPGIAQTKQTLNYIEQQVLDNQNEMVRFYAGRAVSEGGDLLGELDPTHVVSTLKDAFSLAKMDLALQSADYPAALEAFAKVVASAWGKTNPYVWAGQLAVEKSGDLFEELTLVHQQSELVEMWWNVSKKLSELQAADPQNQAEWGRILQNLHGDYALMHAAFQKSLAARNLEPSAVIQSAMQSASRRGPSAAFQVGSGMENQDFALLSRLPGINPDFIAALRRERELLSGGPDLARATAAAAVNKYSDGSYIYAFGPSRGLPAQPAAGTSATPAPPAAPAPSRLTRQQCSAQLRSCLSACDHVAPDPGFNGDLRAINRCGAGCNRAFDSCGQ